MNTILFDLDGTLLPLDNETFEKEYFKRLVMKLSSDLPGDRIVKYIWEATLEMVLNTDPCLTNKEVFMEKFAQITSTNPEHMYGKFLDFYRDEYKCLSQFFKPSQYMVDAVKVLKDKKYELVVATNPLFPKEAILERMVWAGLDEKDFLFITTFEDMHFCKPQIKYYEEILERINKKPGECLMIGNDVEEDLASRKLGIKTYLIEDNIINKKNIVPDTDYKGSYKDFYNFVLNLENAE